MKPIIHSISSPCSGTIERIATKQMDHVYEWERLFLVKTENGTLEEIAVGVSGYILSLEVRQGEDITPSTVLARLRDDLLITGSD